uniref:Uncharacterized protein n=1 Tax=Anguilla anguilla TaxID=7936 RepID=A0A0E9QI84_ANGAN
MINIKTNVMITLKSIIMTATDLTVKGLAFKSSASSGMVSLGLGGHIKCFLLLPFVIFIINCRSHDKCFTA